MLATVTDVTVTTLGLVRTQSTREHHGPSAPKAATEIQTGRHLQVLASAAVFATALFQILTKELSATWGADRAHSLRACVDQ